MQAGMLVKIYHSHAREHNSLSIQHQGVMNKGEKRRIGTKKITLYL